ncbi:hypothetical protein HMPREF3226_01372 [Prevotella corporis]|uniref:Uncharacterized protein n=1 Tax=Prevotella corporis TaxID=28128 RepID=A0A133Q9I7_9BACT|nr:hypothetical protein HMPREF3226_01372 [Prevotella corporis]
MTIMADLASARLRPYTCGTVGKRVPAAGKRHTDKKEKGGTHEAHLPSSQDQSSTVPTRYSFCYN